MNAFGIGFADDLPLRRQIVEMGKTFTDRKKYLVIVQRPTKHDGLEVKRGRWLPA